MKKILIFLLMLVTPALALVKYSDKIWYEKPGFQINPQPGSVFLTFKTPLTGNKIVLLPGGRILVLKNDNLELYDPDFKLLRTYKNLRQDIGWDNRNAYGLVIPSPDGKKIVIGYANRPKKEYNLVLFDLKTGEHKLVKVLDKLHFPGIAPIKRAKNIMKSDPEFAETYFSLVYSNFDFEGGAWVKDKLYLWFRPEYGLHFGGFFIYDLKTGKLSSPIEKVDHVLGIGMDGSIAYTILKDEDATTPERAIYVKTPDLKVRIPNALINSGYGFNGSTLVYTSPERKVLFYSLKNKTITASFDIPGKDFRILYLTPSGNRLFFMTRMKNRPSSLYVYDLRDKKYQPLITDGRRLDTISSLSTCFDAEFFIFREGNSIWAGYLTDRTPPSANLKISPLYKEKAFLSPVNVRAYSHDMCFTSGIQEPSVEVNGKKYRSGEKFTIQLQKGTNNIRIAVTDRAGNKSILNKKIVLEAPLKATLKEIGENPEKYTDKIILLEGYAWGWMTKQRPAEIERLSKLPLARGNTAKSRNDGSFSDGTALAFFPISPGVAGKYRVYAVIVLKGNQWIIKPLHKEAIQ